MATIQQIYEYSIEMNYVFEGEATPLHTNLIKYMMIENDYDTKNMPIIFVSLALIISVDFIIRIVLYNG